ncbi:MAG: hypothetical protein A3F68_07040 [Acidobacteria bacterium RIFCSPLOWO2_12_FULL_54_10]|nr:MAG: hypothetical protein A3F68_07040 [Acidobacteria bacterium RIFCSPLOWO2_12_FULL_54_10]
MEKYSAESILRAAPLGVMMTDLDWRVCFASQPLLDTLGITSEVILGEPLLNLPNKLGRADQCKELISVLTQITGHPLSQVITKVVPVHVPEKKFIRVSVSPYKASDTASGYLLLFGDSTAEGEIDEMKNEFISVASHEMRTPMTSIKGSLELLLGGYAGELPAEMTELLGICLTAVDRLIRLINDMLDVAKIESGKMQLHMDRIHVVDCAKRSIRSMKSLAEANHVSILVDEGESIPQVRADRDRLEQIITNLLANAVKYSPAEGIVTVRIHLADGSVRISVIDQGQGIPPDQIGKIFDRFQQLEGAKKGTGLGLTISRALVEQHHGRIWVESAFGKGSKFHFELPAVGPAQG